MLAHLKIEPARKGGISMDRRILYSIISLVVALLLIIGGYYLLAYYRTTYEVTISYDNIHDADIIFVDENGVEHETKSSIKNGDSIRIPIGSTAHSVVYQSQEGFADGVYPIKKYQKEVEITPAFSDEKLQDMYTDEEAVIKKVLLETYPDTDELYRITHDRLYEQGEWFGVILTYDGSAVFNRDDVGLIMQKKGDKWEVVTKPPLPAINPYNYAQVPLSVVTDINRQLHP